MFRTLVLAGALILSGWFGAGAAAASGVSVTTASPAVPYDCTTATGILQSDCVALVALYNGTNGAGWTNHTNWLATSTPCSGWNGVTCVSNRVVVLALSSNLLSGTMPVELGNLTGMQTLYLDSNQLTGPIPSQLGSLAALLDLDLSSNQLSGAIPSQLGSLTSLQLLQLSNNTLSGPIPTQLGSMTSLQLLGLSNNTLSGSIPTELGSLTNLHWLNLSNNQLTGAIPTQLSTLAGLQILQLGFNQLTGTIPAQLGSLTSLQQLDLGDNQISGTVPAQLAGPAGLTQLYLTTNPQLNRGLPQSLRARSFSDFWFDVTALCEPPDLGFQTWLGGIVSLFRTNVKCAPVTSPVVITRNINDVVLTWTDQPPNTEYEVYRSLSPYFTPAAGTLLPPILAQPTSVFTDTGAIVAPSNYYYLVRSKFRDSANDLSADSNQTGKFSFLLVPGQ